ncbi:tyrosine-type recombinase/integrase [Acidithiobacillus sp.]|uniref:tyrosine-type recombinase/integrase n=1 Tax=Acidithiobacillus sp. TaxID=1872118 RepID=UPI003D082706
MRDIKPDTVERIHRDGDGLELRVYPSGGKIWQLRYQFGTTRRIMRLGEYPALSLADARKKTDKAHELLDAGIDPKAHAEEQAKAKIEAERIAKMEQAARKTFSDVFMDWNTAKLSKRNDGADLLRAIRKDVLAFIGDKEMGAVTRADLLGCLDAITARGALRMANRMLTTLKTFYGWAQLREVVSVDPLGPVRAADVGGKLPSRDRILSDAEIVEMFRKLPESGLSSKAQTAVLMVLATGCRLGEICLAEWAHVTDTIWVIPAENAKNGKEHKITLSPFAQGLFRALQTQREGRWCVPSSKKVGSHQTRMSVGAALYDRQTEAAQRQGRTAETSSLVLEGGHWTAHDLRRTCASGMQKLGVMPAVIDAVLNHKESKGVTQIYQRYDYAKEMADAWAKWGKHLTNLRAQAKGIALVAGE